MANGQYQNAGLERSFERPRIFASGDIAISLNTLNVGGWSDQYPPIDAQHHEDGTPDVETNKMLAEAFQTLLRLSGSMLQMQWLALRASNIERFLDNGPVEWYIGDHVTYVSVLRSWWRQIAARPDYNGPNFVQTFEPTDDDGASYTYKLTEYTLERGDEAIGTFNAERFALRALDRRASSHFAKAFDGDMVEASFWSDEAKHGWLEANPQKCGGVSFTLDTIRHDMDNEMPDMWLDPSGRAEAGECAA